MALTELELKREQDVLSTMSLDELRNRKAFCLFCVSTLEKVEDSEPRKFDALKEYHRQADAIQAAITKLDPNDKPADIVVGLKTAVITAIAPKSGESNLSNKEI